MLVVEPTERVNSMFSRLLFVIALFLTASNSQELKTQKLKLKTTQLTKVSPI